MCRPEAGSKRGRAADALLQRHSVSVDSKAKVAGPRRPHRSEYHRNEQHDHHEDVDDGGRGEWPATERASHLLIIVVAWLGCRLR